MIGNEKLLTELYIYGPEVSATEKDKRALNNISCSNATNGKKQREPVIMQKTQDIPKRNITKPAAYIWTELQSEPRLTGNRDMKGSDTMAAEKHWNRWKVKNDLYRGLCKVTSGVKRAMELSGRPTYRSNRPFKKHHFFSFHCVWKHQRMRVGRGCFKGDRFMKRPWVKCHCGLLLSPLVFRGHSERSLSGNETLKQKRHNKKRPIVQTHIKGLHQTRAKDTFERTQMGLNCTIRSFTMHFPQRIK